MEQSKQRTYKLISVGKTLYLSWCWKLWGFDFMLSCFHQNFWKLERGQLLQFAKCVNCRYFLWSLRNENLRQCLNDGNISFVIKPKPTEHFSLNWSIYYFFFFFPSRSRRLYTGSEHCIFHHKLLLKFPIKNFLIFTCCFCSPCFFSHHHCMRFQ